MHSTLFAIFYTNFHWLSHILQLIIGLMFRHTFSLFVSCIYSDCKLVNTVPLLVLQEGIPYKVLNHTNKDEEIRNKLRMEELARSVAVDELSDEVFLRKNQKNMIT